MPVKLNSSGGGSVTLDVPATAGTFTLNLPAANGDVVVTGGGSTVQFGAGSAAAPSITFSGDTNTGIYSPAADTIAFAEGGVEAMRLDASGNVGIGGTAGTGTKLEVVGPTDATTSAGTGFGLRVRTPSGSGSPAILQFTNNPVTQQWGYVAAPAQNVMTFGGGALEYARISNGNFLVGTTSTFDVTSGATTQLSGQCAVFSAGSPNTIMSFYNSSQAARVGFIGSSGNSTSYNSGSDYRLKENVTNISAAAAAVQSLRPVTFTWKVSPDTGLFSGFIAHELQEVWPEAVVGEKDAICSDGVTPNYQMVDQSKLVPLLTAALQEALTRIETLEARLAALEAR